MKNIKINFDELYRYDQTEEHSYIAIPFPKGEIYNLEELAIMDNDAPVPVQSKVTAYWDDGSIKWGFFRFLVDLKRCSKKSLTLVKQNSIAIVPHPVTLTKNKEGEYTIDTGKISFKIATGSSMFKEFNYNENTLNEEAFPGINLKANNSTYSSVIDSWEVIEEGELVVILLGKGRHIASDASSINFEIELTAFANKSYIDTGYRIINTSEDELHINELTFDILFSNQQLEYFTVPPKKIDSTGCGDGIIPLEPQIGPVFNTMGILDMDKLDDKLGATKSRICVGTSNYRTEFYARNDGKGIYELIDSNHVIKEANEHYFEVFYGTFFLDRCTDKYGICATIYKAQQNYPKAVYGDSSRITIALVPDCDDKIVMQPGMARTQHFMLHFHDTNMSLKEIDHRSLVYQLPNRPYICEDVYHEANIVLDVFVKNKLPIAERNLIAKGDEHARAFGMLNYGDAPDPGYTKQGRGNGEPVWTNNEYDFPHACALMFMRSGIRRFEDYMIVAAEHWMDVDICHYSKNPLLQDGQWEHTNGHSKNGQVVCSHQWVEGLLDTYHLTGNKRAYDTAIGIGKNVLRLLDTPIFASKGEINARETGWALRTLVALYLETNDESWLTKCDWIVGHFKDWEEEYGHWLSPYTDNTAIRVPFMISIAIGSLMRYYRVRPTDELKEIILRAIDDMVENCILDTGLFYYKQLPSLNRLGGNTLVLEALTIGFELTQDKTYLEKGIPTFQISMNQNLGGAVGNKTKVGDAIIVGNIGPKGFAQCFIPLSVFYKAIQENDIPM